MKKAVHILMYLAMGIMLMHSVVPHQHHGETREEEHCLSQNEHGDDSLWEILSDFFHIDLGDDHLENLRQVEGKNFAPYAPALLAESTPIPVFPLYPCSPAGFFTQHKFTLPRELIVTLRSLRSPPIAV